MAGDISRNAYYPQKRYSDVRMQQGKVVTDDDFNEHAHIDAEDQRRTRLDVIGPAGTAGSAFQIANPRINAHGQMDFVVGAGTYYLGGMRLESFGGIYSKQADWLQQPATERPAPTNGRVDLVYLEAWQQTVEAVEDSELFETALGGTDTATRTRTMYRIRVARGVSGNDCAPAWQGVVSGLAGTYGAYDADTGECVPDTKLTVTFEITGVTDDLCSPSVTGGYLGGENQAVCVQIVDGTNLLTWGFDNGAPLYRVTVGADRKTITLLTEPKDQAHWMQANQVVEILPWSAVLSNGEKLAETAGHLSKVAAAYDPDHHTLTLNTLVPNTPAPGFGKQWTTRDDAAVLGPPAPYYFMRVWNRGETTSPARIGFTPGIPVTLGHTGLCVTLTGTKFVPGTHWTIAARPEDPSRVVPWDLLQGRAPHGTHRFFTPLGLIRWAVSGSNTSGTAVQDCRTLFNPLTRQRTCCTFTVGEHGQYKSIQAAIDNLPLDGGCICILPGRYEQDFQIIGQRNITIEGCGRRTVIVGAASSVHSAVASIVDSEWITLRSLSIMSLDRIPVQLVDRVDSANLQLPGALVGSDRTINTQRPRLAHVRLEDLTIVARDLSAVVAAGGRFIELLESDIGVRSLTADIAPASTAGRWPAVFVAADDVLIEKNLIVAMEQPATARQTAPNIDEVLMNRSRVAFGGVQIAGGSERVEIRRNRITGGTGNGITLGSIALVPQTAYNTFVAQHDYAALARAWTQQSAGFTLVIDANGCIQWIPDPTHPNGPDGHPLVPVSTGALSDVRILDNDIVGMGLSGIGVVLFFDLSSHPQFITVDRLTIEENRIHQCLRVEFKEITDPLRRFAAYGAIALADGEDVVIRQNAIETNGTTHIDPICGIFVLQVEGIAILGNVVRDNGPRVQSTAKARPGLRGGIVVALARQPSEPAVSAVAGGFGGYFPFSEDFGMIGARPAARIHDNVVVCQDGQALILRAQGAVSVVRNSLASRGATSLAANFAVPSLGTAGLNPSETWFGATVLIENLGVSGEIGALISFAAASYVRLQSTGKLPIARLPEGVTLFSENQVVLDVQGGRDGLIASSVSILALDDVAVLDNQFAVRAGADILLTDLLAIGWSLRVANNRMSESLLHAFISALAVGSLCTVADNQSTHCLWVISTIGKFGRVNKDNLSLVDALSQWQNGPKLCPLDDDDIAGGS